MPNSHPVLTEEERLMLRDLRVGIEREASLLRRFDGLTPVELRQQLVDELDAAIDDLDDHALATGPVLLLELIEHRMTASTRWKSFVYDFDGLLDISREYPAQLASFPTLGDVFYRFDVPAHETALELLTGKLRAKTENVGRRSHTVAETGNASDAFGFTGGFTSPPLPRKPASR